MKDPIASGKAVTTNERPGAKCHSTRRRGEGPASLIEVRVRGGTSQRQSQERKSLIAALSGSSGEHEYHRCSAARG